MRTHTYTYTYISSSEYFAEGTVPHLNFFAVLYCATEDESGVFSCSAHREGHHGSTECDMAFSSSLYHSHCLDFFS
jgi:hypothetical protein